jgi:hypothetical protein
MRAGSVAAKRDIPGRVMRALHGMIRRVAVTAAGAKGLWQLSGFEDDDAGVERFDDVEWFGGAIVMRPKGSASAIICNVGARDGHPVIIGARLDYAPEIAAGEAALYTAQSSPQAMVLMKADGTIEARSTNGTAVALATKADMDTLRTWLAAHTHVGVTTGGGTSGVPGTLPVPTPAGTQKLRAE